MLYHNKVTVHPIRHLLFIRFLSSSLKVFLESENESYYPFGSGPWPCLNPVSDHYLSPTIEKYQIYNRSKPGNPIAIFKCSCGFVYSRIGPDTCSSDKYKIRHVFDYGHVWREKLKERINNDNYSVRELAIHMGCGIGTIRKELNMLKSNSSENFIVYKSNPKKKFTNDSLESLYKSDIIKYLEDNKESTRSEVYNALKKQCTWLYRYRKDWLYSILPDPIIKKGRDLRKNNERIDWNEMDAKLSDQVLEVINEIKLDKNLTRASLNLVRKKTGNYHLTKNINKLKKTKSVLENNLETVQQFQKRRIDYSINKLKEQGIN